MIKWRRLLFFELLSMSKSANSLDAIPQTAKTPLFSLWEALALLVAMVFAFFGSQLLGIYIAGKLLLPSTKSQTAADLFYFASGNGTIVSSSIVFSGVFLSILIALIIRLKGCLLYTSPSPRDKRQSRMPSSA